MFKRTLNRIKKRIALACLDAGDVDAIRVGRNVLTAQDLGGMAVLDLIRQIDKARPMNAQERFAILDHVVGTSPLIGARLAQVTAAKNGWALIYAAPSKTLTKVVAERLDQRFIPQAFSRS